MNEEQERSEIDALLDQIVALAIVRDVTPRGIIPRVDAIRTLLEQLRAFEAKQLRQAAIL